MDLLEGISQVRTKLGVHDKDKPPRGKPFRKGNEWRFNSPQREMALARKRADCDD
jgi:hypothetical protein